MRFLSCPLMGASQPARGGGVVNDKFSEQKNSPLGHAPYIGTLGKKRYCTKRGVYGA